MRLHRLDAEPEDDGFARCRVPTHPRRALAYLQYSKTRDSDARAFLQMLANIVIDLMDALKRSIKGSGRQKAAALNANTSSKKTKRPRRKRRAA